MKPYWEAPAERLAMLRIGIGTFALGWVLARFGDVLAVAKLPATQFRPVLVTRLLDEPLPYDVVLVLTIATIALLVAFIAGVAYRVTAPIAAVLLLWTLSYRNSWGIPFHTENLLVLQVIALALAPAADVWALARPPRAPPAAGYGWAIRLCAALVVVTYVLAGIAKLRIAGFDWLDGELLRNQIAVDNARKSLLGDSIAPLATTFLAHPALFTVFSALTLVVELGAPVALLGGRFGKLWALAAWGFHLGVVLLMNIWFLYPLSFVAFLPMFEPERPVSRLIAAWRSRRNAGTGQPV
ncbi:MAG: HTTM domain-containing protein [Kofleriaceae bacterium]